jgi:hypothetical protein
VKGKVYMWVTVIAVLVGLLLVSGPAAAGTVNFDDITPGNFFTLHTGGVTFSSQFLEVVDNPSLAVTPPNVLDGHTQGYYNKGTNLFLPGMTMVFDQPQFYATFHFLDWKMSSFPVDLSVKGFELRAFDQGGKLVDRDRFLFDQPTSKTQDYEFTGDKRFTVSADGIKSMSFDAIIDYFGNDHVIFSDAYIDNLAFSNNISLPRSLPPPVPIPGSLLLLGSGLLGMLGISWRQKK